MLHVDSIEQLNNLSGIRFPVLVRAKDYEIEVKSAKDFSSTVLDILLKYNEANIYELPSTLGEMLENLCRDTGHFSSSRQHIEHPMFSRIVAIGDLATRYILLKLAAGETQFVFLLLLRELTKQNPAKEHAGQIGRMIIDWYNWGIDNKKIDALGEQLWKLSWLGQ